MAKKQLLLAIVFLVFLWSFGATVVLAQEFRSTNFVNSNPVVNVSGGKSTSTNFQLFSGAGQVIVGESSSSAFASHAGFFYFPFVSTPVISATAGDAQVALTWTSAVGALGFNVTAYSVGQSANSGGPYSFTNVGNALASTRTGLTNGTTYYFVVRALDFLGDPVVTSTEVSSVPVAAPPPPSGGGGVVGGGGGSSAPAQTMVIFSGRAYPKSSVTLLKDAQVAAATTAGSDASFQISLASISAGNYIFSLYSEDRQGNRSSLLSFPVSVTAGATTKVSGIFLSPSIDVDKNEVKRGDNIAIFGQSTPNSDIIIQVNSDNEIFAKTNADKNGAYLYNLDTSPLDLGVHLAKSKAAIGGEISSYSKAVGFLVGNKSGVKSTVENKAENDLNGDSKVNLIDFSVLAYWYKRPLTETAKNTVDLNKDGKVDLIDFSIMAYHWTG